MDKSELKKAYKQAKRPMGVYRIKTTQNKNEYVGFATDLEAKFNRHKAELKFGSHRNKELQTIWKAYGESALIFEVLDVLDEEDDVNVNRDEELQVLTDLWIKKMEKMGNRIVRI